MLSRALPQKMALLEAQGSFCLPPSECDWKDCLAKTSREHNGASSHLHTEEASQPLIPPSVLSQTFPRSRCHRSTGNFLAAAADIVDHHQLSEDEHSQTRFTLDNPIECQLCEHLPHSRLIFSEFTSLIRDSENLSLWCSPKCRVQELIPNLQNQTFRRGDLGVSGHMHFIYLFKNYLFINNLYNQSRA